MTAQPPGWYPDPFAAVPGASRYWDGERWTTQVQSPLPQPAPYGSGPSQGSGTGYDEREAGRAHAPWGDPGRAEGAHPEQPWSGRGERRAGELASWGQRVGAYLIDAIPMVVVGMLMLTVTGAADAMNRAIESGDAAAIDAATAMLAPLSPAGVAVTLANLLFVLAYNIGFHVARGQTPGKMLLGIRVRMVDEDRNPDVRAAGTRCLVQFGPSLLNGVAGIGFLAGVFNLVDHLWPLWDRRSQTIHDKAARTVVVRTR